MTPNFTAEDIFMPVDLLPASLQKLARKRPIPFSGSKGLLEHFVRLKTMDAEHGRNVQRVFYTYFSHFYEQLRRVPPGYERGLAVLQTMDFVMSEAAKNLPEGQTLSCSKGCNHCCHMRVTVTASEAEVLLSHISRLQIKLDRSRLEKQSGKSSDAFTELGWQTQSCGLLAEDGTCKVYNWRPVACRKYAVVSPPERCDGRKYKTAHLVSDLRAEALSAALLTLEDPYPGSERSMADQLLKHIPKTSNLWIKNAAEKAASLND